jgi:polyhydroxybutyrate depolymerase
MFAPSGGTAGSIETSTKLTPDALGAGFVIAYVDTVSPANIAGAKDAAGIPSGIAERWCIDRGRVYLTGSSDGGGLIYTILLNHYMTPEPAAVAPFAAGASKNTLAKAECLTPPMPSMIMHNSGDAVFPAYGQAARDWWVSCNACGAARTLPDNCLAYGDCAGGAEVRYCEGEGGHGRWPGLHASMFEFFLGHTRSTP